MAIVMTPDYLAKSNSEHAHQRALFAWVNMAANYGFFAANCDDAYGSMDIAEQIAAVQRERGNVLPHGLGEMFAIPNGGLRDKITAGKLKTEGVKAGVSDIFLPVPRVREDGSVICGLFTEMKEEKRTTHTNGGLSPDQVRFGEAVSENGYLFHVAYSWRVAANHIEDYYRKTRRYYV